MIWQKAGPRKASCVVMKASSNRCRLHYPQHASPSFRSSPAPREGLIPAVIVTNELVENYSKRHKNLDFIDVYSKMLDARGHARPDLFLPDRLHLNAAGYAIWKDAIAEPLR